MTTKLRALLYARVSSPEQAKKCGLQTQLREGREHCRTKGYAIAGEYIEAGVSADDYRPEFDRLQRDAEAGVGDVIVMWDPDRLARKLSDQLFFTDEIEATGKVRLEFVTIDRDDSPEGNLFYNIKGSVAEWEKRKIRQRTMKGRITKALEGKRATGGRPYGYRVLPDKPYQIVPDALEGPVVRRIYRWVVEEGWSLSHIARELTATGIRPRKARAWAITSIQTLLKNPVYKGMGYYNRRERVKAGRPKMPHVRRTKLTSQRWRPEDKWIAIPCEPLVSEAMWAHAQTVLDANRKKLAGRPPQNPAFILRGLLFCPCGRRMVAERVRRWRYYVCHLCRLRRPAPAAEETVWHTIFATFTDRAALRRTVRAQELSQGVADVEIQSEVAHLESELAKVKVLISRHLAILELPDIPVADIQEKLAPFQRQRDSLTARLAAVRAALGQMAAPVLSDAALDRECALLAKAGKKIAPGDAVGRARFLRSLVDRVTPTGPDQWEIVGPIFSRGLQASRNRTRPVVGVNDTANASAPVGSPNSAHSVEDAPSKANAAASFRYRLQTAGRVLP